MTASCDKPNHNTLPPLAHLVEHLRWGCTGQAQQVWLIEAAFAEHAHQLAELQRLRMAELDLTGQKARIVGRIVDLIDPKEPTS